MPRLTGLIIFLVFIFLIDLYSYQGFKTVLSSLSINRQLIWKRIFWFLSISGITITGFFFVFARSSDNSLIFRAVFTAVFILFIVKLVWSIFLGLDDLIRGVQWVVSLFVNRGSSEGGISRNAFLVQTGGLISASLGAALTYGVTVGSHHYKLTRQRLRLKGYSKELNGLRLVQISDIHSGSFWNKRAVARGVNMILEQKPDLVFFTGDMVNNRAEEFADFEDLFGTIQAPLGVYAVLGNHDYADYVPEYTPEQRIANVNKLAGSYERMGWRLLRNEAERINYKGANLNVIGVENWSASLRFPKYGDLQRSVKNVDLNELSLLLSHDPTHWKGQVLEEFPEIDVTFSGHTHGMQFGIETAGFKWSPVQYLYAEWAGLYEKGMQKLYVNRGFGYLGYPGRLGIRPEITVFDIEIVE